MKGADVAAVIEKRQDFNTSGGPNWTPRGKIAYAKRHGITLEGNHS